jgi:hypothetical protein
MCLSSPFGLFCRIGVWTSRSASPAALLLGARVQSVVTRTYVAVD